MITKPEMYLTAIYDFKFCRLSMTSRVPVWCVGDRNLLVSYTYVIPVQVRYIARQKTTFNSTVLQQYVQCVVHRYHLGGRCNNQSVLRTVWSQFVVIHKQSGESTILVNKKFVLLACTSIAPDNTNIFDTMPDYIQSVRYKHPGWLL